MAFDVICQPMAYQANGGQLDKAPHFGPYHNPPAFFTTYTHTHTHTHTRKPSPPVPYNKRSIRRRPSVHSSAKSHSSPFPDANARRPWYTSRYTFCEFHLASSDLSLPPASPPPPPPAPPQPLFVRVNVATIRIACLLLSQKRFVILLPRTRAGITIRHSRRTHAHLQYREHALRLVVGRMEGVRVGKRLSSAVPALEAVTKEDQGTTTTTTP